MDKTFKFYIPLEKQDNDFLVGIASTLSVDRDSEKMSTEALVEMKNEIINKGVNLFGNHEHQWENTLGVIKQAEVSGNELKIGITLDDESTNPKIPMLLNKLSRGIKLGLSVGGAVTKERWEYDRMTEKKIKVIDGVKLYEVSVVGIPSNTQSFLSLPQAIGKCMKEDLNISKCPVCFNMIKENKCKLCLWRK